MNDLFNFGLVIMVQLVLFFVISFRIREKFDFLLVLKSMALGLPFGIIFDLMVGRYLGIFSYSLGDSLLFLAINGALSYGLMIATVWSLHSKSFFFLYGWTICIGVVYEVANYLFPVWSWLFAENTLYQELILIFAAYAGLSALMAACLRVVYKIRFIGISLLH